MKKNENSIYDIVDENFMSNFSGKHIGFMKDYYYKVYYNFCRHIKKKILPQEVFFTNMRRRKIKLLQLCCPYCGHVVVIPVQGTIDELKSFNYCWSCGKSSATYNVFSQLSSLGRIGHFHAVGLKTIQTIYDEEEIKSLTYEVYHLEVVQLTSILEVILRDFFEAFIHINYFGVNDNYISNVINKSTGNDFMKIDKANQHYKKALNINLRSMIDDKTWFDLIDLVNIRNTIIHNNGMIDDKFKKTKTFQRIQDCICGDLIFLDEKEINNYLKQVTQISDIIGKAFEEKYSMLKYGLIANYYFNNI